MNQLEVTICDFKLGRQKKAALCILRAWCADVIERFKEQPGH